MLLTNAQYYHMNSTVISFFSFCNPVYGMKIESLLDLMYAVNICLCTV